ncbi:lytic transglycosylase domain-containing protein [Candidatus Parabeggiatoa sp. HSG14]|uniref:lytic transglycosylase domain-containing protein n=1 Tax=Candidatus Parabeggiatoa sp. HSG14 TaxID=3055593 RepID=UPI0025A7714B|nr:lytic transglycosylase domain-containing protein [Thiotrichales bacterium HSG14]
MKRFNLVVNILGVILLSSNLVLQASEIYSYVDIDGVRHYSDRPPDQRPTVKVHPDPVTNSSVKIYKFVDSKGVIHLTDSPKDTRYKLIYLGGVTIPTFSSNLHSKSFNDYSTLIQDVATRTFLEPALLHAVIQVESAYNPNAVSPKGAVGLMQLMPATAKRYGVTDRTDAAANVYGGALYLYDLLKMFNNNKRLALASYNAGENAVKRYGNKIPPYRETKNYVKKVMKLYRAYQE